LHLSKPLNWGYFFTQKYKVFMMKISQQGIALIKQFEGCKLKTYKDSVGVLTIGYGHTGADVKTGMTITQAQAEELLKKDVARFEIGVTKLVDTIPQNQFDALVSFAYNVGLMALEKSTLLRKLRAGDTLGAANEFPRWNKAGGRVLTGLTRRRAAEQKLFLS
jgi:lysozyme